MPNLTNKELMGGAILNANKVVSDPNIIKNRLSNLS